MFILNKARKTELLFQKAKGQRINATPTEMIELRKYKIDADESSFYATKSNISAYITAVDNGCRISFYDWCMNNKKADRRRKGSSEKDISNFNKTKSMSFMFIGWLTWGIALYWMSHGSISVGVCAIAGAVISFILSKFARKTAGLTLLLLPIILAVYFGSK